VLVFETKSVDILKQKVWTSAFELIPCPKNIDL